MASTVTPDVVLPAQAGIQAVYDNEVKAAK